MTSKMPASHLLLLGVVGFVRACALVLVGLLAIILLLFGILTTLGAVAIVTMYAPVAIGIGIVVAFLALLYFWAKCSQARLEGLPRGNNPVLIEAQHRGDFADFAEQLRRRPNTHSWRTRDVRRALPVIDEWARESGQA